MHHLSLGKHHHAYAGIIMAIVGLSLFLALVGSVLTAIVSVGHVSYPIWMHLSWDTVNVLLMPVAAANILLYIMAYKGKGCGGLLLDLLFMAGPCIWLYAGERDGYLSVVLFTMLAVLFVMNWSSFYPVPSSQKMSALTTAGRVDASEDVVIPPLPANTTTHCLICKAPCLYETCLECEDKHKTEIHKVRSHNMRAKKAGEPATLTIAQWLDTLSKHNYQCAYCSTGKYEALEHYFPLGSHDRQGGTTALNCVPSCKKCNLEKSNKHPEK